MNGGGREPVEAPLPPPRRAVDASKFDTAAAEQALDPLRAIGADVDSPDLLETPRRVAASFAELVTPAEFAATSCARTMTSVLRGLLPDDPGTRQELVSLVG